MIGLAAETNRGCLVTDEESLGRSFDPLSGVNLFRYDLEHFGQVLPETRSRVCDEQLSYLAEGIDRAARTTFMFQRQSDDLVYFNKASWRPYTSMVTTGLKTAEHEAAEDPRKQFLADRAQTNLYHAYKMRQLQPGQKMFWGSVYPRAEAQRYGAAFIESCGFFPNREMGFLYCATCRNDGCVILESQTIDRSDEEAFEVALQAVASRAEMELDDVVAVHDQVLSQKYGGYFYAGRREAELHENAWKQMLAHGDVIDYLLHGLDSLANQELSPDHLEEATKRHIYGVWALFKKRLDGTAFALVTALVDNVGYLANQVWLRDQTQQAFQEFASRGHVLVGCGGTIEILLGEADIMSASGEAVLSAIFGGKGGYDKYGSLSFKCTEGHANIRPHGKLIDKCQHRGCKGKVKC